MIILEIDSRVPSDEITEDRESVKERVFLLGKIADKVSQIADVRLNEMEVVGVNIKPQETVVIVDYFGDKDFLGVLRSCTKEVSEVLSPLNLFRFFPAIDLFRHRHCKTYSKRNIPIPCVVRRTWRIGKRKSSNFFENTLRHPKKQIF